MKNIYQGAELFSEFVPDDTCKQTSSIQEVDKFLVGSNIQLVLDLGCGDGNSVDFFRKKIPDVRWIGLDIESSLELKKRNRTDVEFSFYDGVNIPFEDNYFDLIYSHQVFEHVQYPKELMKEINRVLKCNGIFVGSTSHLEAFHGNSTFNYTPYGFTLLLKDTQLVLLSLKPGIDVFTLLLARLTNRFKLFSSFISRYFQRESPVNLIIGIFSKLLGKSNKDINLLKLLFSGHFVFILKKICN
jgi:ubiquinone/menaquinone biosynthesis C-methylase UbiE